MCYFDLFDKQILFKCWQIFCLFPCVSALNVVRCTTLPQTVQQSANGWPNAQMIQRQLTISAHTLKMYERHKNNVLPLGYVHTAAPVQSCVWMWSQSQDFEQYDPLKLSLDLRRTSSHSKHVNCTISERLKVVKEKLVLCHSCCSELTCHLLQCECSLMLFFTQTFAENLTNPYLLAVLILFCP